MSARKRPQGLSISAVMMLVMGIVVMAMWYRNKSFANLPYASHMEDTALTIDGEEYQLKDLAFYLASQESKVQKQARAYDLKQPQKYWNAHTNGSFVRVEARDALIEHAVHDEIFYKMAKSYGLEMKRKKRHIWKTRKWISGTIWRKRGKGALACLSRRLERRFITWRLHRKNSRCLRRTKDLSLRCIMQTGANIKKF